MDPHLDTYEKALKAFHKHKWSDAAKLLQRVAAESDQTDLVARAQVYLAICEGMRSETDATPADPYLEAVMAKNSGDLDHALAVCSRGGRRGKEERFAYLAASAYALSGNVEEALSQLQVAVELNPKNRIHAYHDCDFEALREESGFAAIIDTGDGAEAG